MVQLQFCKSVKGLTPFVILGKSPYSLPQFPHVQNGNLNSSHSQKYYPMLQLLCRDSVLCLWGEGHIGVKLHY